MNIPIQNIYIMLIYSWQKHNEKEIVNVGLEGQTDLQNLFAKVLINGINHLFKRGVNRDYRSTSESIRGIKGKIDFNASLKKNLIQNGIVECEFDEFDEDNIQNQIIKATLNSLLRTDGVDKENKVKLAQQRIRLTTVSDINLVKTHFTKLRFNSNNRFYEFLINVCEMIHDNLLPGESKGKYKFRKFTDNEHKMRLLFESFVRNFYAIEADGWDKVKSERMKSRFVPITKDSESLLPDMVTDISLWNNERKIIIDTKFTPKAFSTNQWDKKTLRSGHLYQLNTYLTYTESKKDQAVEGILLYPAVKEDFSHEYQSPEGYKISVKSIDLNKDFDNIKSDLMAIIN